MVDVQYFCNDFDWKELESVALLELDRQDEEFAAQRKVAVSRAGDEPETRGDENEIIKNATAAAAWDSFHSRHSSAKFFKERRYVTLEFPELAKLVPMTVLEVGCGTASTAIPILRANPLALLLGCDCSEAAVNLAAEQVKNVLGPKEARARFQSFLWDITRGPVCGQNALSSQLQAAMQDFRQTTPTWSSLDGGCRVSMLESIDVERHGHDTGGATHGVGQVDIVTLMFTLSALTPAAMPTALQNLHAVLKPGGMLLFRDYGLYDMAQLRFSGSQKIAPCLYRRQDGTLAYFFSCDYLSKLATAAGFIQEENHYCCIQVRNRHRQLNLKRVWLHAKFRKPVS